MSLLDSLKPVTAKWMTRYRRSPLPAFLSWWKAELVACLPRKWRAWFTDRRETWFAFIEDGELRFQREGADEPMARFALDQDKNALRADLLRLVGQEPHPDRRLILAVPEAMVLLRSLQFPVAVEQNLPQVLSFEMDRQTPFKADQVYFDYRAEPNASGKQLQVDLAITPRPALDGLVEQARGLSLPLDGADMVASGSVPRRHGFNLLPEAMRSRRSNPQLRLNLILGAAALLLLVMAMQQSVANRGQALEALRANVDEARVEARVVTALRAQLNNAVDGAGYLTQRKLSSPSVLRVLADLSARLPDDTWLESLNLNSGTLNITGQSSEATRLIALLQESRVLSGPSFSGRITPNPQTQKDRFILNAQYDPRPGFEQPPASSSAPDDGPDEEESSGQADVEAPSSSDSETTSPVD